MLKAHTEHMHLDGIQIATTGHLRLKQRRSLSIAVQHTRPYAIVWQPHKQFLNEDLSCIGRFQTL
uniref:Uncharacterized protein n=1 Tax=Arundo donax TaxID=35708 RepID=A0A0A9G860_ARUDO